MWKELTLGLLLLTIATRQASSSPDDDDDKDEKCRVENYENVMKHSYYKEHPIRHPYVLKFYDKYFSSVDPYRVSLPYMTPLPEGDEDDGDDDEGEEESHHGRWGKRRGRHGYRKERKVCLNNEVFYNGKGYTWKFHCPSRHDPHSHKRCCGAHLKNYCCVNNATTYGDDEWEDEWEGKKTLWIILGVTIPCCLAVAIGLAIWAAKRRRSVETDNKLAKEKEAQAYNNPLPAYVIAIKSDYPSENPKDVPVYHSRENSLRSTTGPEEEASQESYAQVV